MVKLLNINDVKNFFYFLYIIHSKNIIYKNYILLYNICIIFD